MRCLESQNRTVAFHTHCCGESEPTPSLPPTRAAFWLILPKDLVLSSYLIESKSHCWGLPGLMKTISFGLCCEIEFLKSQLSPRRERGGNEEHPLHGLLICAPASWASAAQGRTHCQPRASGLIKDPDCWSYEKHLRKKLGKRCQKLEGGKKKREWKNRKWSVKIADKDIKGQRQWWVRWATRMKITLKRIKRASEIGKGAHF